MACIFCAIVSGEIPSWQVYSDDDALVILDKYPVSKGHLLIIPRKHYQGVEDVPMALADKLWRLSTALAKIYRNELKATGVNVITNSGRPAGQEIFHFHIHVIPRWTESFKGIFGPRHEVGPEEAEEVLSMWRDRLDSLRKLLSE